MRSNVDVPIITTKLHRPFPVADLVSRSQLLEKLNFYLDRPLTLVSAPAGYGKTTLISSWLASLDNPTAWVSLDEHDDDLTIFLSYFLAAIRTMFPDAANDSLALINAQDVPPLRVIVSTLINDLTQIDGSYVLVLDDYHAIHNMDIHDVIGGLLRYPPSGLHLVLTTRKDPPIKLIDLRARSWLNEIRIQELRFTKDEISEYLQHVLGRPVENKTVKQLAAKSEGWVTGLRLLTLSLQRIEDFDLSKMGRLVNNYLVEDYLMSIILSFQDPAFQDCLIKTAVLERFCAPLCEVLCRTEADLDAPYSGEAFICLLEESNLFVTPLDTRHQWFRYHHLFQDLLLRQLQKQKGDDTIASLHKRASVWYEENGYIDEALRHALSAGDIARGADIVAQHRHDLMNRDRWRRLERWLDQFPEDAFETYPDLLMARGWVAYYLMYDLVETMRILDVVDARSFVDDVESQQLKGEAAALRSQFQYWFVDAAAAMASAQYALEVTPIAHECVRSTSLTMVSHAMQMEGEFDEGLKLLKEALRGGLFNIQSSIARVLVALCWSYWLVGDLKNSKDAARRLLLLSQKYDMAWSTSYACYFLGIAHLERMELAEADQRLGLLVENPYRYPMHNLCQSVFPLGIVYQIGGDDEKAGKVAQFISDLAFEKQNNLFIELAEVFQAELEIRRGHTMIAGNWAEHYQQGELRAMHRYFLPELTYVKALIAKDSQSSRDKAADLLSRLETHAETIHNNSVLIRVLALQAWFANILGDEKKVLAKLERAVRLGTLGGWIRPFVDLGSEFIRPLQQLRQKDIAPDHIGRILDAFPDTQREQMQTETHQSRNADLIEPLTDRELEVLGLLAEQLSNKEIGAKLFISPGTVKQHTYNIYQKLGVKGRWPAVTKAIELGILPTNVTSQ